MTARRIASLAALLAAPLAAGCLTSSTRRAEPAAARSPGTTPAVTAEELRARLFVVADDSMEGRAAGSPGALRTQRYLERELRRLGVLPAGEQGGYTQAARLVVRRVGASALTTGGGTPLALWRDFVPIPWPWIPRSVDGAPVIYGGELGASAIDPAAVAGKFVVMRAPGGRTIFPRVSAGDPLRRAAAVAIVGLERYAPERLARFRTGLEAGLEGSPSLRDSAPVSLVVSTAAAESLFGKRLDDLRVGDVGPPVHGGIAFADSTAAFCCNVVGVVRGADPALAGEYVALGAHLDHLGTTPSVEDHDSSHAAAIARWALRGRSSARAAPPDAAARVRVNVDSLRALRPARRDSIFNGADDDGSGTVALLEIAEALASGSPRPRRSVLFVWHTGEELGNQGSTWFTDHPTVPLDSVVAQLNLDMIGRGSSDDVAGGGARYLQVIGARRLSRDLGDAIERVNAASGARFTIDYQYDAPGDPRFYYCRSDHFEYARHGIPIAFFTTGEHADYHGVTDEPQYIDYPHFAAVTRFVLDVVRDLANAARRPALDGPKPDPAAACRG